VSLLALALVCLLAPFVGFLVQYFVGRRLPGQGAWLTVFTIGVSLACAVWIGAAVLGGADEARDSIEWFAPGGDATRSINICFNSVLQNRHFI